MDDQTKDRRGFLLEVLKVCWQPTELRLSGTLPVGTVGLSSRNWSNPHFTILILKNNSEANSV